MKINSTIKEIIGCVSYVLIPVFGVLFVCQWNGFYLLALMLVLYLVYWSGIRREKIKKEKYKVEKYLGGWHCVFKYRNNWYRAILTEVYDDHKSISVCQIYHSNKEGYVGNWKHIAKLQTKGISEDYLIACIKKFKSNYR